MEARKIRIGNNIKVIWQITNGGEAVPLEGKNPSLVMCVFNDELPIRDFSYKDNAISFLFPAEMQKYCGPYTLWLSYDSEGSVHTIDKHYAFILTPTTDEEAEGTDAEVTILTDTASAGTGIAASIVIGTTTTLPAGSKATVENVGTANAAILNFGIPQGEAGKDGTGGKDGSDGKDNATTASGVGGEVTVDDITVKARPASVTFNVASNGVISSTQDTKIVFSYTRGTETGLATITEITSDNFAEDITFDKGGSYFLVKGSAIKRTNITDADGNNVVWPVSNANVYVKCSVPGSKVTFVLTIPVYVNTSAFFGTVYRTQKEFQQKYNALSESVTENGTEIAECKSTISQTANEITASVEEYKTTNDANIESLQSSISVNAEGITAAAKSVTALADTVSGNTKKIAENESSIAVVSDGISALSKKITFDSDGNITNIDKSGLLVTADKTELSSEIADVNGKVVDKATISTMIEDGVAKAKVKASQIELSADDKLNLTSGTFTIESDNFKVDESGNASMTGEINAKSGTIGDKDGKYYTIEERDSFFGLYCSNSKKESSASGAFNWNSLAYNTYDGLQLSAKAKLDSTQSGTMKLGGDGFCIGATNTSGAMSYFMIAPTAGNLAIFAVGLPTSSTGLSIGQIWNDNGTLKIKQ